MFENRYIMVDLELPIHTVRLIIAFNYKILAGIATYFAG